MRKNIKKGREKKKKLNHVLCYVYTKIFLTFYSAGFAPGRVLEHGSMPKYSSKNKKGGQKLRKTNTDPIRRLNTYVKIK